MAEIVVEVRGELYMGPPKTRAGRRIVTLPRSVVEELAEHLGPVGEADAWVFTADKGGAPRPSNFRVKVSVRAGHTSVAFTLDRYGHLFEGHDDELRERLDAMHAQGLQAVPGGTVVELPGGPMRPRRSKQQERPAVAAGLTSDDGGAPPGTRTPNRCLKRALLCQLS